MKKIGIVGCGFIGKSLINNFLKNATIKYQISVFDHNVCPLELMGKVKWTKGDFKNNSDISHFLSEVDYVYNFIPENQPSNFELSSSIFDNLTYQIRFLKNCEHKNIKQVIFSSSASVYGIQDQFPIFESATTNPISQYGISKLMTEKYYLMAAREFNFDICIARISNPFGEGQIKPNFIQNIVKAIKEGYSVNLVEGGAYVRDFIYIDDITNMLIKIIDAKDLPPIVNLSSGEGYSLKEVVNIIEKIVNVKINIKEISSNKNDIPVSILSNDIYKNNFGNNIQIKFEDRLKMYIEKVIN